MPNNRIFYAIEQLAIKDNTAPPTNEVAHVQAGFDTEPDGKWEVPRGIQNVGVTTTFNVEQLFQLGQAELYEYIERQPDIEMTIDKVFDGTKPLWFMLTSGTNLIDRTTDYKTDISLNIYDDNQTLSSGTPLSSMTASGMYVSQATYTFSVDGNFTESLTVVGNDKVWADIDLAGDVIPAEGSSTREAPEGVPSGTFTDVESANTIGSGVQRREDFLLDESLLPADIPGVAANGALGSIVDHVQTITISFNLNRTDLFELGKKRPFAKLVQYPVEVTTSIEVISSQGDLVDARSEEVGCGEGDNTTDQPIKVVLCDGSTIDLGTKNKLQSVDYQGGGTDGSNVTVTYNYSTFNKFDFTHEIYS